MGKSLFYFDDKYQLQFILNNDKPDSLPFDEASREEGLDLVDDLEVRVPADNEAAAKLVDEGFLGYFDKDKNFQLFEIYLIEEEDSENGLQRVVFGQHVFAETDKLPVYDKRPQETTATAALDSLLEGQAKWQRGIVADLGIASTNFYHESIRSGVVKILEAWGGELRKRITFVDNEIKGFFIDILARRGADTGKIISVEKDAASIKRKVERTNIYTAIVPRGKGEETEGGGYSRRLTIEDVNWSQANGDPIDKPLGQKWIGDEDARLAYGIPDGNGGKLHKFLFVNFDDTEDAIQLINEGWETLQQHNKPLVSYSATMVDLESQGLEHEKVRLGDTNFIIDDNFSPPLRTEARIIKLKERIDDETQTEPTLGNFLPMFSDSSKVLDDLKEKIGGRAGIWDKVELPTSDLDIENIPPEQPAGVKATALFAKVVIDWVYDPAIHIAAYEVYGSAAPNFLPDSSNLLYRGKSSSFAHEPGVGQQWYYLVRAINTHGVAGPFSAEVSATTYRILTDDILFGAITAEKLADLAVTAQKLADAAVTTNKILDGAIAEAKLAAGAVTSGKIYDGAITNTKLAALAVDAAKLASGSVTEVKLATGAVTNEKMAALAVDAAKLAAGSVTEIKLATGAITNTKLANLAVDAAKLAAGAVGSTQLADNAVTNAKIADLAVSAAELANSSVTATKIANLAVGTAAIADAAINSAKIALLAVGTGAIQDAVITNAKITNLAVDSSKIGDAQIIAAKIANLAVGNAALANAAVTNAKIGNLAVSTAQIQDAAISSAKIAALAVGTAAIQDAAITNAKISNLDASKITTGRLDAARVQVGSGTQFAEGFDPTTKATPEYVQSRGENLVTNGNGFLGNNYNFSSFVFDGLQSFAGAGSFYEDAQNSTLFSDEYIPVDPSKKYRGSFMAKSKLGVGHQYAGFVAFDIDRRDIQSPMRIASNYPVVALAQDLKAGDTKVYLTSLEGFTDNQGDNTHWHSLALYGYKNSYGYEYPAGTYTRFIFSGGWLNGAINTTEKSITFSKPFDISNPSDASGIFRAGHKLSRTHQGSGYMYTLASNVPYPKDDWGYFEGVIDGIGDATGNPSKFPHGTAFLRFLFLTNRSFSGGQAGDAFWLNSVILTDVSQEQNAKNFTTEAVKPANERITLWQYADTSFFDGGNIYTNSVTANKMAVGTITAASGVIADAAITSAKIANLAVGNAALANAAVTNAKIGMLAVATGQIQDAAITNAKIGSLSVDTAKIADGAITSVKIDNAAITNAKIANAAIDTAKIADAAITSAKIASLTAEKISTGTLSGVTIDVTTEASIGQKLTLKYNSAKPSRIVFPNSFGEEFWSLYKNPSSEALVMSGIDLSLRASRYVYFGDLADTRYTDDRTGYETGFSTANQEEGMCGIGTIAGSTWSGSVVGTVVPFRLRKQVVPSGITLIVNNLGTNSTTPPPQVADITRDGFWLYLTGSGNANAYLYWRGRYRA